MSTKSKQPRKTNRIFVISGIDEESYYDFSVKLQDLEERKVKHVVIELNSAGGSPYDALAFCSRMRLSPCAFTVVAHGIVASAATLILAAGTKRQMAAEAWCMVHEDSGNAVGTTTDIELNAKHMRAMETQWNKLLSKYTKRPEAFWTKFQKRDRYLTPAQCLELGLIDEVI